MKPTEPLALHHSWPLHERSSRLDLGMLHDDRDGAGPSRSIVADDPDVAGGAWACDLSDDRLHWSPMVYRLFGFPADAPLARAASVACYAEASRAAMERLRAHAIRHRRGFTLDVEIVPVGGRGRWIRLDAAPICADTRVIGLHGYKRDVTALYRRR